MPRKRTARDDCERRTLTIAEAASVLGIGRNQAYRAAHDGTLPVLRLGARLVVPKAALAQLLGEHGVHHLDFWPEPSEDAGCPPHDGGAETEER